MFLDLLYVFIFFHHPADFSWPYSAYYMPSSNLLCSALIGKKSLLLNSFADIKFGKEKYGMAVLEIATYTNQTHNFCSEYNFSLLLLQSIRLLSLSSYNAIFKLFSIQLSFNLEDHTIKD